MIVVTPEMKRLVKRLEQSVEDLRKSVERLCIVNDKLFRTCSRPLTSGTAFAAWLRVAVISLVILVLILLAVVIEQHVLAEEPEAKAWAVPAAAPPVEVRITSRDRMRQSFMREQLQDVALDGSDLPTPHRCARTQRGDTTVICIYQEVENE